MSKHIIFKIETNKLFRIFLNSEYSKFVIYNDLNIVLSSKRNVRTFKYNEISKISGETGICFSSVKIQTVYNEVFELPFLNKRKTQHADKWMNALLLCKKYKDIDSKIKGYFNSESYISYLQNSLFYEENINNNSRALSYRAEICKLFPNLKFDIEYPYLNSYLTNKDAERDKNNKKFLAEEPKRNAVYFEDLNKKQIEAVITDEDNVLVVAGAGSGKTKVIEARIQYLIENKKTDPDNILVLTFNKEACAEVKKRVTKLLNTKIPHIKTFHGFGLSINRDSEKSLAPFCDDKNKYQNLIRQIMFIVVES